MRIEAVPFSLVATLIFLLAICHTFLTAKSRQRAWTHVADEKICAGADRTTHFIMFSTDSAPTVYSIDETSAEAAFAPIVLAFVSDPAARWSWPRADDYLRNMPLLARAFGGKSFGLGTAFGIDRLAGAALWLPPGVSSDEEALASLIERTAPASIQQDAAGVFEQMASFHPHEPHWYLPLIGVDPARQGQRLGDKLMAHALAHCDADRLPAYLESSNPRNIPFYQRHGFEVRGKIQVGSSPTLVPMLRRPRAPR